MKILVTGAEGQLGLSIKKVSGLWPQHDIVFTDLPGTDITDTEGLSEAVSGCCPQLIVNCAAYTDVDGAEKEPEKAFLVNRDGAGNLAELCRERDIPLIHISTDYVFGGCTPAPLSEQDPTGPVNVYGKSKLAGEEKIKLAGCRSIIIRTSWLYSEFGRNFVKTMLSLIDRDSLRVVYDQTGTPTYAEDLARAVLTLADREITGQGLYHYSNGGVTTWYDLAKAVFDHSGPGPELVPVLSSDYPTKAERPRYTVLSKAKIEAQEVNVPYWLDSLKKCISEIKRTEK